MKKNLIIICSAMLMLALMSCGGKGGNTETPQEEIMQGLKAPEWEKFVVVTQEDMAIYREADENSAKRMVCYEDAESDMIDVVNKWSDEECPEGYLQESLYLYPGEVFPCVGEEGDFYKVALCSQYDREDAVGYIAKSAVEEVKPMPITKEAFNGVCTWGQLRVFDDGKYKNMVMRTKFDELDGEFISMGKLFDGVAAFAYTLSVYDNTEIDSLRFNEAEFTDGIKVESMEYPASMKHESEDDYLVFLDLAKLSDEQVGQLYDVMVKDETDYVEYLYYFPTIESEFDRFQSFYVNNKEK